MATTLVRRRPAKRSDELRARGVAGFATFAAKLSVGEQNPESMAISADGGRVAIVGRDAVSLVVAPNHPRD